MLAVSVAGVNSSVAVPAPGTGLPPNINAAV